MKLRLNSAYSLFLVAFLLFTHANAEIVTDISFLWGDVAGTINGYSSPGDVVGVMTAQQDAQFAQCAQGSSYSCSKNIYGAIKSGGRNLINGKEWWLSVDVHTYSESLQFGQTTSYLDPHVGSTAVQAAIVCPKGFSGASQTYSGTSDYKAWCSKSDTPPAPDCPPCSVPNGKSAYGAPGERGNPINTYSGTKTERQTDYVTADGLLSLSREYVGQVLGWNMPGSIKVADVFSSDSTAALQQSFSSTTVDPKNSNATIVNVVQLSFPFAKTTVNGEYLVQNPDGSYTQFVATSNGTFPTAADGTKVEKLSAATPEGAVWRRTLSNDDVEEYGLDGSIKKKQFRDGKFLIYQYQNGVLTQIQDNWGRKLVLTYLNNLLQKVTLPDGLFISYDYQNQLLTKVTYQDGSYKQFLYNEPDYLGGSNLTYALTGIIDENNKRVSTYRYSSTGIAVSTEWTGGVNKYSFDFHGSYTHYTSPLNGQYYIYFTDANGQKFISNLYQPDGAGSSSSAFHYNYDNNGNVASSTDFNGVTTTYSYDLSRNLETSRVEASGTASARTITTAWHPTYRLPLQVNEPLRRTVYTYDANGNVLTKTEQATSDVNGSQGAAAAVVGSPRVWSTTYNTVGQVLTAIGPRTDIVDKTTYTYDTQGNLTSVTNAAGHITTLSNYDPNGRVGSITDPNGLVTTLTYTPRGWLSSRVTTGGGNTETTSYTYDGVGQMTQVTLPDNSKVNYTYDDAHRLTKITDSLGNSINYTLDNMGNRTTETVADASGNLSRNISRVYDALNRLQQITGAAQ